jgi:CheY-like chemotaxis protein/HPt (histidine-containing phosphotransfer) domain-containing protein
MEQRRTRQPAGHQHEESGQHITPADALSALAILGQDLRSTLVGTAGAAELAVATEHDQRGRTQISEILDGLHGALQLVDDLLSFAGAVGGEHEDRTCTFTAAELLGDCLARARSQVQRSAVVARSVLGKRSDLLLKGDRGGCEMLITTLLRSTITRASGHDVVASVAVAAEGETATLTITVGDESSTEAVSAEDARMLRLCRGIAKRLGGNLQELSGAGYRIRLGLAIATERPQVDGCDTDDLLRGREVLVVDDDPALRRVYATLLNDLGARCEEAADGLQAVERCRDKRFDLVVMDLNMPRMDGFAATQTILEQANAKHEPVPAILAITALSDVEAGARSLQAGAIMCLRKPLQRPQVEAAIRACLARDESDVVDGAARNDPPEADGAHAFTPEQVQQTLDLMGGGEEAIATLRNLIDSYRVGTPDMVTELRENLAVGRAEVEQIAHTLKSRSAALGLCAARDFASEIESLARRGDIDMDTGESLLDRFDRARARGVEQLEAYLALEVES